MYKHARTCILSIFYSIGLLLFTLPLYSQSSERDTVFTVASEPLTGFSHPYLMFLPAGIPLEEPVALLVEAGWHQSDSIIVNNTGLPELGTKLARKMKVPLLVPMFPGLDAITLSKNSLLTRKGPLKRIDLQLVAMIRHAYSQLDSRKIKITDKVLLVGFGNSATFANRFAALHPQVPELVVLGGIGGNLLMPADRINGLDLEYPTGISDIKKISGSAFESNAFRSLPLFIFQGGDDHEFEDQLDLERNLVLNAVLGPKGPGRWSKASEIYEGNGVNATFREYLSTGHDITEPILKDIIGFYQSLDPK